MSPCPWGRLTLQGAAARGHLHVLQWAWEHGFPWNTATCRGAAMNGHMGVLRWSGGAG